MSNAKDKTIIIGNFDGVHLGHQKLINLGKKISRDTKTQLALITFRPHPKTIILDKTIDLLLPYEAKIDLIVLYYAYRIPYWLILILPISCLLGSIFQVLFTYVLMKVFAHKNFATGIAFSKTEVILIAFLEIIILSVTFSTSIMLGIILGVISVLLLSYAKKADSPSPRTPITI